MDFHLLSVVGSPSLNRSLLLVFPADLVPSPFAAFSESSSLMFSLSRIPREGARQVPSRGFLPPVLVLLSAFGMLSREAPLFEPTSRHISPIRAPRVPRYEALGQGSGER